MDPWMAGIGFVMLLGATLLGIGLVAATKLRKKPKQFEDAYSFEYVKMATQRLRDRIFEAEYVDVREALLQAMEEATVPLETDFRDRSRHMVLIGALEAILDEPRGLSFSAAEQRRRLTLLIDEYRQSLRRGNEGLKEFERELDTEETIRRTGKMPRRERHH